LKSFPLVVLQLMPSDDNSNQILTLTKRLPNQIKIDNFIKKEKLTEAQ